MKVLILRGIPGSGKTKFCTDMKRRTHTEVVSSDHFFESPDGTYKFDVSKLGLAHAVCMRQFSRYLEDAGWPPALGRNPTPRVLIVDNTNLEAWECSPYVLLSDAFGIGVAIYNIECDPGVASRNLHGVSSDLLKTMYSRYTSERLPNTWRCFYDEQSVINWLRHLVS